MRERKGRGNRVMSSENKRLEFAWLDNPERIGEMNFTFDGKKIFNLFRDYPYKLTQEQKALFDKENPYWANFFKDRK